MATHSSILAWEILWTESLVGYRPWVCKELDMTEHTHTHTNNRKRALLMVMCKQIFTPDLFLLNHSQCYK